MFWLFMAVWLDGHPPHDYKIVAKTGPFETYNQCWAAGSLAADKIQSKDDVSNALGACKKELPLVHYVAEPVFLDFKSMWDMVCASMDKPDLCWLNNGQFVDPTKEKSP